MKPAKILVVALASALTLGQLVPDCKAATGTSPQARNSQVFDSTGKASDTELADFKANPKSLLKSNPIGGFQLASLAKALALTDTSTVANLIDLIGSANPLQIAAIGSGLGQAARELMNSTDEASQRAGQTIQSQIEAVESASLNTAFENSLHGPAAASGKAGIHTNLSSFSGGAVGGGVGGAVNQGGSNSGSQGVATTNAPPVGNQSSLNTTETIPFSGAVVTCTSSVSPAHAC